MIGYAFNDILAILFGVCHLNYIVTILPFLWFWPVEDHHLPNLAPQLDLIAAKLKFQNFGQNSASKSGFGQTKVTICPTYHQNQDEILEPILLRRHCFGSHLL